MIFTNSGRVFWIKVHEIPQVGRVARGQAITNLVNMSGEERIAEFLSEQADIMSIYDFVKRGAQR